ncbi:MULTISPECIES: hypothetical protein [Chelativorans]|jgi:hypothetical protein|uniref:Uncharacterized protein n=1 Tax=Chelativorans sp. (strain BNC1) TaxID=266779 RepID=Q11MZ9_CHESB|nr:MULTISPECIES: hypothetical protein [Chelativorans]
MFFRRQASGERIVAVAVQLDEFVLSLPAPARHEDLYAGVHRATGALPTPDQQGFLTSKGRFVKRHAARDIAIAAGQADRDCLLLTSQHLW